MEQHLYLPPPTFLWKIPHTEVCLTRGAPYLKLNGTEFDHLPDHMKAESEAILKRGIAAGTVALLNKAFIPEDQSTLDIKYILSLPGDVIQRKFVSKMDKLENIEMIQSLITEELKAEFPRKGLLNLFQMKIDAIKLAEAQKAGTKSLEDQFLDQFAIDDEALLEVKVPKTPRS